MIKKKYDEFYTFAFVRNPYERFVSNFFYFKGTKNGKLMNITDDININDYISKFCTKNFIEKTQHYSKYHFNEQSFFICENGKNIPYDIFKLENINDCIDFLYTKGVILKKNVVSNSSQINNYNMLNESSKKILQGIYYNDFINFYPELL